MVTPPAPSDADLLKRYARARDEDAFARLVARHMRGVRMVAFRHTHHRQAAEDVAQAAFLVLAQRPKQAMRSARMKRSALPWLAKVARYAAANWRRAEERRLRHETRAAPLQHTHYDPTAGVELADAVRSALGCLSRRDRRIVELRHLSQMPWDQVARHAGTTSEAARKAGTRALVQLRTVLEKRGVTVGAGVLGPVLASLARPTAAATAPAAFELAQKVILMIRIKTASTMAATAASVFIGTALVSSAIGGQEAGPATTAQPGAVAPAPNLAGSGGVLRIPLTGETALEIVAVSDGAKFWTADGVPLDEPAFEIAKKIPPREGMRVVYVKFAMVGDVASGELPPELVGKIDGPMDGPVQLAGDITGMSWIPTDDGRTLLAWMYASPSDIARNVRLHVAAEPWTLHELTPYDDSMLGTQSYMTHGVLPEGSLTVTPIAGVPAHPGRPPAEGARVASERSQLSIMMSRRTVDLRPILLDWDGKSHAMAGGGFLMGTDFFARTYVADVPPDNVRTVAVVTRGMHQVEATIVIAPEPEHNLALRRVVTPPPRRVGPSQSAAPRDE